MGLVSCRRPACHACTRAAGYLGGPGINRKLRWQASAWALEAPQLQPHNPAAPWRPSGFARYLPGWTDGYANASWLKHPRGPLSPKRHAASGLWLMTCYHTAPLGAFAAGAFASRDARALTLAGQAFVTTTRANAGAAAVFAC